MAQYAGDGSGYHISRGNRSGYIQRLLGIQPGMRARPNRSRDPNPDPFLHHGVREILRRFAPDVLNTPRYPGGSPTFDEGGDRHLGQTGHDSRTPIGPPESAPPITPQPLAQVGDLSNYQQLMDNIGNDPQAMGLHAQEGGNADWRARLLASVGHPGHYPIQRSTTRQALQHFLAGQGMRARPQRARVLPQRNMMRAAQRRPY